MFGLAHTTENWNKLCLGWKENEAQTDWKLEQYRTNPSLPLHCDQPSTIKSTKHPISKWWSTFPMEATQMLVWLYSAWNISYTISLFIPIPDILFGLSCDLFQPPGLWWKAWHIAGVGTEVWSMKTPLPSNLWSYNYSTTGARSFFDSSSIPTLFHFSPSLSLPPSAFSLSFSSPPLQWMSYHYYLSYNFTDYCTERSCSFFTLFKFVPHSLSTFCYSFSADFIAIIVHSLTIIILDGVLLRSSPR